MNMERLDKLGRPINPNSLANLKKAKPWKKGQSGNPSGKSRSHFDVPKHSRKSGPVVVKFWKAVMQDEKMPIGQRMRASENLMNRGTERRWNRYTFAPMLISTTDPLTSMP
jgi:hypothetical protein